MKRYLLLLLGNLCLLSCTSVRYFSADSLVPADVTFAPSVKRVAIVDNTVPGIIDDYEAVTINALLQGNGQLTVRELAAQIADSKYFDEVVRLDSLLRGTASRRSDELIPPATVDQLLDELNADLLVSVDRVGIKSNTTPLYLNGSGEAIDGLAASTGIITRLYLPGRDAPFQTFVDVDTLYFPLSGLTDKAVVTKASKEIATLPLKHIVPQWKRSDRYYYETNSYEMRDARVAVERNDWEQALQLWQKVYDRKKAGKGRQLLAANLALANEMLGNLDDALRYVEEALGDALPEDGKQAPADYRLSGEKWRLLLYRQELKRKLADQPKLNLQMERFNNEN